MAERLADGSSQHGGSEGFVHERLSAIEPGLAHDRVFGITGHVQHFQRGLLCGQALKQIRSARTGHDDVGLCWNSNPTDVINGSVRESFDLLKKHIRNCHINELSSGYPYREFFALLQQNKYERYTLCEAQESKEPERYLRNYKALWTELGRKCA